MGETVIVTGEIGKGKTTKVLSLIKEYRREGINPAGIVSENRQAGPSGEPDKSRYFARDLRGGETRLLASEFEGEGGASRKLGRFFFFEETFTWASAVIEAGFDAPALFIDEIGPLELAGGGFRQSVEKAVSGYAGRLILVVRRGLVADFVELLGIENPEIIQCPG